MKAKRTLLPPLALLFSIFCLSCHAQVNLQPAGVAIVRERSGERDEFARAIEYISYEAFPQNINFKVPGAAQSMRILRANLAEIVPYPDLTTGTFVDAKDRDVLSAAAMQFADLAKKYPRSKSILTVRAADSKAAADRIASGEVMIKGQWLSKSDYDAKLASKASNTLSTFSFGGKIYIDVNLTTVANGNAVIRHTGGTASLRLSELTDAQIEKLNKCSTGQMITRGSQEKENLQAATTTRQEPPMLTPPNGALADTRLVPSTSQSEETGLFPVDVKIAPGIYGVGYMNRTGKIVIPARFREGGDFSGGLAWVREPRKAVGYIDKTGDYVIQPRFQVGNDFEDGFAVVTLDSPVEHQRQAIIDQVGSVLSEKSDVTLIQSGKTFLCLGNDSVGCMDSSGNWLIPPGRFKKLDLFDEGLAPFSDGGKFGYADLAGKIVIAPRFDVAGAFKGEKALVKNGDYLEVIDKAGKSLATLPGQSRANRIPNEGLVPVKESKGASGKMGYCDLTGKMVIPAQFDEATEFSEGRAFVGKDGRFAVIDTGGHILGEFFVGEPNPFKNGLSQVILGTEVFEIWCAYIDRNGQFVWKPEDYGPYRPVIPRLDQNLRRQIATLHEKGFVFDQSRWEAGKMLYYRGEYSSDLAVCFSVYLNGELESFSVERGFTVEGAKDQEFQRQSIVALACGLSAVRIPPSAINSVLEWQMENARTVWDVAGSSTKVLKTMRVNDSDGKSCRVMCEHRKWREIRWNETFVIWKG